MNPREVFAALVCLALLGGLVGPAAGAAVAAGDDADGRSITAVQDVDAPAVAQQTDGDDGTISFAQQGGRANETAVDPAVVDDLVEEAMAEYDVAGATASVVQGDELVYAAGYGDANAAADERVDPNETPFMIGSVSKLFVWTLVLQGVEEGTLDLDEPIDTYLDDYAFEGDDEVTLEHLGTHSAGYEDRLAGIFVEDAETAADWEANLERDMPAQVREPGETVAYSNHGAALAGLVLQEAYDQPFEDLVAGRIYEPLGMTNSTFEQPVPDDHPAVSKGHVPSGDGFETDDPAIVGVPPAGSMSATATDVARFASAALDGAYEGDRLLSNESVAATFEERATNHPGVEGVGYGYMRTERSGEAVRWHTGGTEYFTTLFALFPERDVGLFVSFNSPGGGAALMEILDDFAAETFGDEGSDETGGDVEPDPATADRADRYAGEYRTTAFQTTYESVIGLADAWTVSVTDEGYLELSNPLGGDPTRWVEVSEGVFEPVPDDETQLSTTSLAIEDDRLYMDAPAAPYERVSWYEGAVVQLGLFAVAAALLLSTLVVWPVSAYRSRGWGRMREHLTAPRLAILAATGLLVAFLVGLVTNLAVSPQQLAYGFSPVLRGVFALLLVFAGAGLAAVAFVGGEWRRVIETRQPDAGSTTRYGLAYLTVLALALLALVWQLWYWNLLGAAL